MKKIKVIIAAVLFAGISAVSCSSDDDGPAVRGEVNGTWNPIKTTVKVGNDTATFEYTSNETGCSKDYIEFAPNAVLNSGIYYRNGADVCTPETNSPGTYGRSDNTLVLDGLVGTLDYDGTYEIIKLNGSELQIRNSNSSGGATTITTVFFRKAANEN